MDEIFEFEVGRSLFIRKMTDEELRIRGLYGLPKAVKSMQKDLENKLSKKMNIVPKTKFSGMGSRDIKVNPEVWHWVKPLQGVIVGKSVYVIDQTKDHATVLINEDPEDFISIDDDLFDPKELDLTSGSSLEYMIKNYI